MARLAAEPTSKDVVFIHVYPEEVKTEISRHGWGGKSPGIDVESKTGMSVEVSWARSLHLITSGQFNGKGLPVNDGLHLALTIEKTGHGALFLADVERRCLQQEQVLGQLRARNAEEMVWEGTQEILGPYF
jgi:hypothetical protein